MFDRSVPAPGPLPEAVQLRMAEGRVFEDEVIVPALEAALGDRCVSVVYGDHVADKQRRIDETVAAMEALALVIIGGQLPDDTVGGRTGSPDVLFRVTSDWDQACYLPADIKNHTTLKRSKTTSAWVTAFEDEVHVEPDRAPGAFRRPAMGWTGMTSHRFEDSMQLAHYTRMLQAMGRHPAGMSWGGVIGTSDFAAITGERYGVVWYDLDDRLEATRSASSETGKRKRSVIEVYDHEFAFRKKVAAAAVAGETLVVPFGKAECGECPYERWCEGYAGDQDASFAITVGRLSDREWRYLYNQGLDTIDALAEATPAGSFLDGFLRQAAHLPTPERRLTTAIHRARMVRDGALLERITPGTLEVPEADVEIDFDVEWHPADGHVYQWGARVRHGQDESTATYGHSVLTCESLDNSTAQALADDFFDWLETFVTDHENAGRTVRIFHWTSPELTKTIRVLGGKRSDALFERFLDLRRFMDEHYFARDGLSLKVVAPIFGFKWEAEDAGGQTSIIKVEQARNALDPATAQAARAWLLSYNEDDCQAQAAIRDGLRHLGKYRRITEMERLTSPVQVG